MSIKLLGISGSMTTSSYSLKALEYVLNDAKNTHGSEIEIFDLKKNKLPFYDPRLDKDPLITGLEKENIKKAKLVVKWADAIVLTTPDYHGSMSGVLKNFLDYFWKEFTGKTFGYICTSYEKGLTVMEQMRTVVRQCYGWSMPYGISTSSHDFDKEGNIINPKLIPRLQMLSRDITHYGKIIRDQFLSDVSNSIKESYSYIALDDKNKK
jgi:azobenzene reductase